MQLLQYHKQRSKEDLRPHPDQQEELLCLKNKKIYQEDIPISFNGSSILQIINNLCKPALFLAKDIFSSVRTDDYADFHL